MILRILFSILAGSLISASCIAKTQWMDAYGYEGCLEISNGDVAVVLDPNVGGRVLSYSREGKNILYVDEALNGKLYDGENFIVSAGRFDVGHGLPARPTLWIRPWDIEVTSSLSARMTSKECPDTGLQLIRNFRLAPAGSHLHVEQVIMNVSDSIKRVAHWSRTFVEGGGISFSPISPYSRYPEGYASNGSPRGGLLARHEPHPSLSVEDEILVIRKSPPYAKFYIDPDVGWLAYTSPHNLLFYKTYRVYPHKMYGDVMASTASVWYSGDRVCEIEPMGPSVFLKPGESTSFTENWYLEDYKFTEEVSETIVDLKKRFSNLEADY